MLLVLFGVILVMKRTLIGFAVAAGFFLAAFGIQAFVRRIRRIRIHLTDRGILWVQPGKAEGAMFWGEIGAFSVKAAEGTGDPEAVMLTPRSPEQGPHLVVGVNDLGESAAEGIRRLESLAAAILPHLTQETVVDRQTREWIAARRGRTGEGGGGS